MDTDMTDFPRLIEHAFPLKQASLDSVHEKNVRHGHISTLHIWPARRPLAACRAALIATLTPDPSFEPRPEGMTDAQWEAEIKRRRQELCEKIGGKVIKKVERKKMPNGQIVDRVKEETKEGILHWGRETENAETLEWFRQEIRKAYSGRAPKVLDPFAGGGAIPLEAMRLGCEATAVDINPVAWFILKCTLEYPQKLAGQKRPLPEFILKNAMFMREFFKAQGMSKTEIESAVATLGHEAEPGLFGVVDAKPKGKRRQEKGEPTSLTPDELIQADLAWHVRAWGQWVLSRARRELAQYYPTYADFEPIKKDEIAYEPQPMRIVPLKDDGTADVDSLNGEFTKEYLDDKRNPRWIAKPTVAYLWARTVTCKNCRATVPLLKTRWLCKKSNKRVLLTMEPNEDHTRVIFGIETNVPAKGGNTAQRREHDKRTGAGTMSRAGAKCPCCPAIMTMEDIRVEGKAGKLGSFMTAVVVDTPSGKDYRLPTEHELAVASPSDERVEAAFRHVPFGVPDEPMPSEEALGMRVPLYGFDRWRKLFTPRQLMALGTFVGATRASRDDMGVRQLSPEWTEAVGAYLALVIGRTANYLSTMCLWDSAAEEVKQTFLRFALPITWDYSEANPMSAVDRYFAGGLSKVVRVLTELLPAASSNPAPTVVNKSAIANQPSECDLIMTDPPYYDAIPYSDLMDFFYIWLRRSVHGVMSENAAFATSLSPKWNHAENDGELIDESSRHQNNAAESKRVYEDGMARAFASCAQSLKADGRLVIVFANKQPAAWETLVSALIRSGFVVDGSWPIATEMRGGVRNFARASLASSVWLVCRKRPITARPGWDNNVLEEMHANIAVKLREFWDAGIRGPDFVWAATGPALEAYSKHPVVRKANEPNATMGVDEFLTHVRRMVVDYIVGQVLSGEQGADMAAADRLDEVTAYYLLHRHDFGMDEAPVGACILYATACGLGDTELEKTWDILTHSGSAADSSEEDEEDTDDSDSDSEPKEDTGGGKVKLKAWSQRRGKSLGYEAPGGKAVPLIDRIHRVMHLWKDGDIQKVDDYLDQNALRRNELFKRVVQSLIELSTNSERSLLESISNHIGAKGARARDNQQDMQKEYERAGYTEVDSE
jgi:adenine-specific DNA methylase